ncbi:MAG: HEPN domain-containing protein [Chitinivibrionales bacterium]|nr:HEPN domain-containing protein [Chitinivibrionales bacterium]
MNKHTENWLIQASYDFDTARALRQSGRNVYTVHMCHLAIEKALKGLLFEVTAEVPPKTHSLVLLVNKSGKKPDEKIGKFLLQLNDASVSTRYPEDFSQLLATYTDLLTDSIIIQTEEVLKWIKKQL